MLGVVVPYALSVHSFVAKVGGYAGVAAVIAIALLVIMFFVNARETSALRDRAAEAEERLYRLEYYAEEVNRNAAAQQAPAPPEVVAAAPAPAPAAAAGVPTGIPFAPAGVGAAALSSATHLIPLGEISAAREAQTAAAAAPVATATVSQATQAAPTVGAPAGNGAPPVAPPPSTAAAAGQASSTVAASSPDPVPAPPPRLTPRSAPPSTAPRRNYGRPAEEKSSRIGRASFAVAGLLVAVIIAAAVLIISHHNSSSGSGSHHGHRTVASHSKHTRTTNSPSSSSSSKSASKTRTINVDPSSVTVAVLNGTGTENLAADVLHKLSGAGFVPGQTGNNPDQTETSTTIGYLPGDRAKALAVASALKLNPKTVVKVPTTSRQVICSTPTACPAQVVVIVGADLESVA